MRHSVPKPSPHLGVARTGGNPKGTDLPRSELDDEEGPCLPEEKVEDKGRK